MIPVAVAVGGALGALGRYGATTLIGRMAGPGFPWGTVSVNVAGSVVLGFLMVWLPDRMVSDEVRLFATAGLLGSFTTFSTFSWEVVEIAKTGAWSKVVVYAGGSVLLGVLGVVVGAAAAVALSTPTR